MGSWLVSILIMPSSNFDASAARQALTSAVDSSLFSRSILYKRWNPFPLSAAKGAGQLCSASHARTVLAFVFAASFSRSLELTPAGRTGSMSTSNQRRRTTSRSFVVAWANSLALLFARANCAALAGLSV